MNYCIRVMLYGMFCGVFGTALGGVIAVFIRKHTDRLMGFLLEFSAGLMVGVSVFNLIPNAMELTSVWIVLLGVLAGILLSMLLQNKLKFSEKNRYGARAADLSSSCVPGFLLQSVSPCTIFRKVLPLAWGLALRMRSAFLCC